MCAYIDSLAAFFRIPSEYVYLLTGLFLGLALGWVLGRQRPKAAANLLLAGEGAALPNVHEAPGSTTAGVSLVVNGKTVEVAPAIREEIQALIMEGNKIAAIKRLREASGLNLAAAKSVVESLEKVIH